MSDKEFRTEKDSMGELQVPANAKWGAQTQRAVNNFPISGLTMPRQFVAALGLVKWAAAGANSELGLIGNDLAISIQKAALEVQPASTMPSFLSTCSRPVRVPVQT